MPDWTYTYSTISASIQYADNGDVIHIDSTPDLMQQMWEEHQQMIDQQEKQAEELRKDKVNYPLFFLKEGIV